MLKNYFKIAWRNLWKEKRYSFINIFGLSVGMAVAILMMLFVRDEWSFDQFHSKSDRTYRAWVKEHYEGELFFNTVTPFVLGRELQDNFPEIEKVARYFVINELVRNGEFSDQENIHLASPEMLEVFDFPLLEGNPRTALSGMNSVVITPEMAKKYFNQTAPIGETLTIQVSGEWQQFQVTGVIAEAPANSSIQYDLLVPFNFVKNLVPEQGLNSWTIVYPETYVLLKEGADLAVLEQKVAPFIDQQVANIYESGEYVVGFQPLADIHLNNDFPVGYVPVSDRRYPYILSGIALLILLLAGINFVTLAVGRSVSRAKEVGVRKVNGATRLQLMQQFWSEAILVTLIAMAGGILLAELLLPTFNQLANKQLVFSYNLPNTGFLISLALSLGLLAGIYPALVASGFSPIKTIRGTVSKLGQQKHLVLRTLVGLQFALSIILIACTFIMQQQMGYLQNKNLGFDQEQMLILPYNAAPSPERGLVEIHQEAEQKLELLRPELAGNSSIKKITSSNHTFGTLGWMSFGYTDPLSQKYRNFFYNSVDYNYIETMGITLREGRAFSREIGTDATSAVLLNETMAQEMNMIGKVGEQLPAPFETFQLIGITEDFNFSSLHNPVEPLLMAIDPISVRRHVSDVSSVDSPIPKITFKISGENVPETISAIQTAWKKVAPDQPFNFTFMDEALQLQYESESRLSLLIAIASMLAILIACLGLFGIATLTTARRTKEIGVRKVLGASVTDIVLLLNMRFSWIVLLANLIAIPITYIFMKKWLADFAYQVTINPLLFVGAAIVALLLAWLAVSYHSLKAARGNPVRALRYE